MNSTIRSIGGPVTTGFLGILALLFLVSSAVDSPAFAGAPRVLPAGERPKDKRLEPPKDLNGYFPFTPSKSPEEWKSRAEQVRRQIRVTLGIWPEPTRNPLNPVIHGKVERDDYTVERVYFESMPGFFVTGSLYRPKNKTGKLPGVLCPHGHWANGRFYETNEATVKDEIAKGGEKFEEGGRSPLQARCVHLARMGCVVFHYDMIGYADSQQIPSSIAHGFDKQRPDMIATENWGLFSPQAESHYQSVMGLQTWNSIRSLDFLTSLPDVDSSRIGVTGASGGGTQTFILCAIDPRPTVAFPAVMVSTAMQGGCTCENASGLRIDTGNVEFAALFAPKPQGMSAADDWTKEMTTKGFPELQQHYRMMGAGDKVHLLSRLEFGHNYNAVSREAMYKLFHEHLGMGDGEAPAERDYKRLSQAELTVWDEQHPRPPSGTDFERKLLSWWNSDVEKQLGLAGGTAADSLKSLKDVIQPALSVVIGRGLPEAKHLEYDQTIKEDRGDYLLMAGLLRNIPAKEELPVLFFYPKQWDGEAVLWLHADGKAGLCEGDQPRPEVKKLVAAGKAVVGVDLVHQGEFLADGKRLERAPSVENKRQAAAYTRGYNHSVAAQRVHDVLTVIAYVKNHERTPKAISLVGLEGAPAAWAAAARSQAGDLVTKAALGTDGFRFLNVKDVYSPDLLPGASKYGDVPAMIAAGVPGKVWIAGEKPEALALTKSIYQAAGKPSDLVLHEGEPSGVAAAAVEWLLK